MPIALPSSSGPFPPRWLSPESISSATRHSGDLSGAVLCKTVESGGRDRACLCIRKRRPEPAQMIPSLQSRELRGDLLPRHVGSEQEKTHSFSGTVRGHPRSDGIFLGVLDSRSRSAYTKNQHRLVLSDMVSPRNADGQTGQDTFPNARGGKVLR